MTVCPANVLSFPNTMSYRPPSSSDSNTNTSNNDWKYVGRKGVSQSHPPIPVAPVPATKSKWGQSALKKPEPKPKTFEDEFPSLGNSSAKPTSPTTDSKPLSMAERMKLKLAEEAAEAERKAEEARKRAAIEKNSIRLHVHTLNFRAEAFASKTYDGYDSSEEHYEDELTNDYNEHPEHPEYHEGPDESDYDETF
jgi:hypothetical protein